MVQLVRFHHLFYIQRSMLKCTKHHYIQSRVHMVQLVRFHHLFLHTKEYVKVHQTSFHFDSLSVHRAMHGSLLGSLGAPNHQLVYPQEDLSSHSHSFPVHLAPTHRSVPPPSSKTKAFSPSEWIDDTCPPPKPPV